MCLCTYLVKKFCLIVDSEAREKIEKHQQSFLSFAHCRTTCMFPTSQSSFPLLPQSSAFSSRIRSSKCTKSHFSSEEHKHPQPKQTHHESRRRCPVRRTLERRRRTRRAWQSTNRPIPTGRPVPSATCRPITTPLILQPPHQLREKLRRISILNNIPTNRHAPILHTLNLLLSTSRSRIKNITELQRLLELLTPLRKRIRRPFTRIIPPSTGVLRARRDVLVEERAHENLVGRFGLVGGHFVAGLVDAGEGEVAVLPHLAAGVGVVGEDGAVAGGGEGGGEGGV